MYAEVWSETSLSFLRGNNFAEIFGSDNDRSEFTFEHAGKFQYGDHFFWLDITDSQSNTTARNTELYGEWSPRLSFGKIFDFYSDKRFVKDILLSTTFEFGRSSGAQTRSRLFGVGLDLKVPYFLFFQYNLYIKDNLDKTGRAIQSTIAYKLPIIISDRVKFSYGAYIDIIHSEEGTASDSTLAEAHWHTGQQFLWDAGALWNKSHLLYLGIEYQHWNRKYGIKSGPVENNLKWMMKYIF